MNWYDEKHGDSLASVFDFLSNNADAKVIKSSRGHYYEKVLLTGKVNSFEFIQSRFEQF